MKRFLIAGLGNPGERYKKNRHNVGAAVVDEILKTPFFTRLELEYNCIVNTVCAFSEMNTSGEKLRVLWNKSSYDLLIVVVDDLETDLGKVKKVYPTMGHKGQNGVRSVMHFFRDNFCTIRIGIGRPSNNISVNDFVLSDFKIPDNVVEDTRVLLQQAIVEKILKS